MSTTNQIFFSNFLENLFPKSDTPKYLTPHKTPYRPFLQVTREIENNKNYKGGGWDAEKQLWFPHASKEGGRQTIGYGHKLTEEEANNNTYVNGLTDQEVEDLYRKDIEKHYIRTKDSFRKKGFGDFDSLPPLKQAILIDYEYTGTGPNVFPKFTEALLKDDTTALKKEYLRYLKKDLLKSRNAITKDFLNLKLGGKFTPKKSQLVKNAEELNSKRDMRKKLIKGTSWPSIKKRIVKKQQGGTLDDEFLNYDNVNISETPLPELTFDTSNFNPYNYISEEPSKREVPNQSSEETSQEPNIQKEEKPVLEKTVKSPDFDPKLGLMGEFVKIATEEGIPFRVTSGYRPNSITSNGSRSWHSKGLALDIIPKEGVSWEVFKNSFNKAPKTLKWIRDNKMGILDETTPEMLARTEGTGAHWHIGRDKMAVDSFSKMFPISKNGGVLKAQWGTKLTGVYTVNPGDNLTKISNSLEIPQDSLLSYNNIPKSKANDLAIGQELLWRKEPEFLDNVKRFFFEPKEESDKSVSRNNIIEKNVWLSKTTKPEVNPIYSTRFKEKNFRKFANTMKTIYSEVLDELGLPKHNISNLVRQDALESTYGTSPRGNGYNLGGIKVFNNKETLGTRHSDGYYYRNFKDLKDYAKYKIKLLHNDYGAIEAPAEQFIDALHGKNKKKKIYSAGKDAYEKFRNMKSLNKYLDESN